MQLIKPEPYNFDSGRHVPKEDWAELQITPVEQIASRTCKREDNNEKWRLGRA